MAQRDKGQGFGFVYVDVAKILAQRDQLPKDELPQNEGVVNLNRDPKKETPPPSAAVRQIRENLDRLQTLHHKLHVMLEELNHITQPEKKKP